MKVEETLCYFGLLLIVCGGSMMVCTTSVDLS